MRPKGIEDTEPRIAEDTESKKVDHMGPRKPGYIGPRKLEDTGSREADSICRLIGVQKKQPNAGEFTPHATHTK